MDQLPTDDMRAHIMKMSKRTFYNDDDKMCIQQIIMLLNSLEALSSDHGLAGDDFASMEYSLVCYLVLINCKLSKQLTCILGKNQVVFTKDSRASYAIIIRSMRSTATKASENCCDYSTLFDKRLSSISRAKKRLSRNGAVNDDA